MFTPSFEHHSSMIENRILLFDLIFPSLYRDVILKLWKCFVLKVPSLHSVFKLKLRQHRISAVRTTRSPLPASSFEYGNKNELIHLYCFICNSRTHQCHKESVEMPILRLSIIRAKIDSFCTYTEIPKRVRSIDE